MSLDWSRVLFYAQQHGIPEAIARQLVKAESGGKQSAISPKGAIGLAQLMPDTAKYLKVNPYDPEQNLEGGMRYLKEQFDEFGSWPLALAAYNAGPRRVREARGIPNIRETKRYVASFSGIPEFGAMPPLSGSVSASPPPVRQEVAQVANPARQAMPFEMSKGASQMSDFESAIDQFTNSPLTQLAAAILASSGGSRASGIGAGLLAVPQMQAQQTQARLAQIKMMAELQKQARQQQIQQQIMPMLSQLSQGGGNQGQALAALAGMMGVGEVPGADAIAKMAPFFGMPAADAARIQMDRSRLYHETGIGGPPQVGMPQGGMPQGGESFTMPAQPPTPPNVQPLGIPQAPPIPQGATGLPPAAQARVAEEFAKKQQEAALESQKAAAGALLTAQKGMATIEQMATHPGFSSAVGWEQMEPFGVKLFPTTSPTTAGFEALHGQVMGQQFLDAVPAMKGMGSLSNAEGDAIRSAATSLNLKSPESQYLRELATIYANLERGNARAMNQLKLTPSDQRSIGAATPEEIDAVLQRLKSLRAGQAAAPAGGTIDWTKVKATRVQ